jgi:hypothetical protein
MSEQRDGGSPSERRRFITAGAGTLVLALTHHEIAFGATLVAVRVWPAEDYTRVTLEHDGPLTFSHFMVRDPAHLLRLVVDIDGLDLLGRGHVSGVDAAAHLLARRVHFCCGDPAVAIGIHPLKHLAGPGCMFGDGNHAVLVGIHHLHVAGRSPGDK